MVKIEIVQKCEHKHTISDAKMIKNYESWTYHIEHKEIEEGKIYKITIEEIKGE